MVQGIVLCKVSEGSGNCFVKSIRRLRELFCEKFHNCFRELFCEKYQKVQGIVSFW
jgi:hypothetical protein